MHLLAYWLWDNYTSDLDEGAGFNFNSKQSRLHSAIDVGDTLWLFTALKAPTRYFLAAKLMVRSKTLNAPGYRYGKYRVWGDLARSRYFRVRADVPQDEAFELLRGLPLMSGSLAKATRATLPQACQTIRGVTPKGRGCWMPLQRHWPRRTEFECRDEPREWLKQAEPVFLRDRK